MLLSVHFCVRISSEIRGWFVDEASGWIRWVFISGFGSSCVMQSFSDKTNLKESLMCILS